MADFELSISELDGMSPLTFGQVGFLLARPALWGTWLTDHPDRADLFKEVLSCVVRLRSHTGWTDDQMLDGLGCDTKTEGELSKLTKKRLTSCLGYMQWVEDLLVPHDRSLDKRIIVRSAARFFVLAGKDLDRAQAVMPSPEMKGKTRTGSGGGGFPPVEYLVLGEVARAWSSAARQLEGEAGERARRLHDENPFIEECTPHLSPKRLEMLAGPDAGTLLGRRVAARIREHIGICHVCRAAAGREAARSPTAPTTPLAPVTLSKPAGGLDTAAGTGYAQYRAPGRLAGY